MPCCVSALAPKPARLARVLLSLLAAVPLASLDARELLAVGTTFGRVFERNAAGEFVGLGVDLVRVMAERTGDTVRFELYPWVRAQTLVERGAADILVGPYKTPERELRFAFAERAFYQDQMVFYVRAGTALGWDGNYARLKGQPVAAILGWAYGASFDRARDSMELTNTAKLENGIQMLMRQHVSFLATNRRNTEALLAAMDLVGAITPIEPVIDVQNGYIAFPKNAEYEALRSDFNRVFNAMVASGDFARLARKHQVTIP